MKETKRAERRHNNKRLLKKRYKQEVQNLYVSHDDDRAKELEWCLRRAKRRLDTNVDCSCAMCGNPRRYHGFASDNVLTFQELRANDAERDGMKEMLDRDTELQYPIESRDPPGDCELE